MHRFLVFLVALGLLGCGDDGGAAPVPDAMTPDATAPDATAPDATSDGGATTRSLSYSFAGLPALGDDFVYEGWLIVDGSPVSTGRFEIDADGGADPASSEVSADDAAVASTFVLTIEPAIGDDPAPAATHVLAGDVDGDGATLSVGHGAALGTGFGDAAGSFILATPSTADTADNGQGIWFLVPGDPPTVALELPALPEGWAYEGWVVDTSGDAPVPLTTGRFTDPAGADSDLAGPTSGSDSDGPPLPGQDYIDPAIDLTVDHVAVISVEPEPDNSPGPFQLKPLMGMIGTGTGPEMPQTLGNVSADNDISGSVMFE